MRTIRRRRGRGGSRRNLRCASHRRGKTDERCADEDHRDFVTKTTTGGNPNLLNGDGGSRGIGVRKLRGGNERRGDTRATGYDQGSEILTHDVFLHDSSCIKYVATAKHRKSGKPIPIFLQQVANLSSVEVRVLNGVGIRMPHDLSTQSFNTR